MMALESIRNLINRKSKLFITALEFIALTWSPKFIFDVGKPKKIPKKKYNRQHFALVFF